MIFRFGKHPGKSSEAVIFFDPSWVQWMMANRPDNAATKACRAHIAALDKKGFSGKCHACEGPATCASVYKENTGSFMLWCDRCDPFASGAIDGSLTVIRTFDDAMRHVALTCGGRKADQKKIVKRLAESKGLPKKATSNGIVEFFSE